MPAFPILGLHHVTATVDQAQADLDFCLDALALRLVKKTVNFDNHHVYHFYYGDERGTPGTIWTTFPYHGHGVPIGRKGAGQVVATAFSVPAGTVDTWSERFRARGAWTRTLEPRFGDEVVEVIDPSGLIFEVIANGRDNRAPWTGGPMGASEAIRGLHSVSLRVRTPGPTIDLMRSLLGFEVVDEAPGRVRVAVGDGAPGRIMDITHAADAPAAANGIGTVHHVAMAIADPDDQLRLREALLQRGVSVTPVRDRQYFQSIYFREPGGVLFEVATMRPGFLVDELLDQLGRGLKLPPWEESNRAEIETGLAPVAY